MARLDIGYCFYAQDQPATGSGWPGWEWALPVAWSLELCPARHGGSSDLMVTNTLVCLPLPLVMGPKAPNKPGYSLRGSHNGLCLV